MIDGQTLAPDLQVMLRMQAIARPRDEAIPFARMRANMVRRRRSSVATGRSARCAT